MKIKISMENTKKMIETVAKPYRVSYYTQGFETLLEPPEEIAKGSMRLFEIRPGFELIIKNMQPRENVIASIEEEGSQLIISFCLSGNMRGSFRDQKGDFVIGQGRNTLCFTPRSMRTAELLTGKNSTWVTMRIEPGLLNSFIEGEFDQISTDICGIIEESNGRNYFGRITSMTPSIHMAIDQILNCPYQGLTKRMYLEGKAMEIMALQLAQSVFGENGPVKPPTLRPADVECIHEVRVILIRNLENPPSLLGLARQVGLNDTKLKRGFRQVFGTTVFGYLQAKRMERGRQLLAEGKMNVTEVAYEVGYSSRAHFTRAFTKRFGCNPIVYLRGNCKHISLA